MKEAEISWIVTMTAKRAELYSAAVPQPSVTQGLFRDLNKPLQTRATSRNPRIAPEMAKPQEPMAKPRSFDKAPSLNCSNPLSSK